MFKCTCICFSAVVAALHASLADNLSQSLVDHSTKTCIVCNPAAGEENGLDSDSTSDVGASSSSTTGVGYDETLREKFGKLSTVVKTRGADWKHKMINYIKNEQTPVDRYVNAQ